MTWLETYKNEIDKGNIIAGYEMKQGLEMYLDDMDNHEYIYDTRNADIRMEFMETFVKLTKSPFYGKPMKLMLWQKAFIECLYSFKRKDTGLRRFKKALLLIARKNTKSETCNGLGLTELMLGAKGSDIVCSSNDDSQANILYEGINTMREMFDPRGKRTHKNMSFIKNKKTGTKIFKLSDTTRNKEGRNIDFAIVDEVHEMEDNIIVKSIETSQSTKDEPMLILITTEGFVNDGYLDKELAYARKILNGEIKDDTYLVWLYTQDSEQEIWQDERSWMKSNPSLGIVKKWDYLRDQLNKAKSDKAERVFTLCKDFNIHQSQGEAWLMESDYNYPMEQWSLEDFRGCYAIGAVDLSFTNDLTCAKVLLQRAVNPKTGEPDNHKYIATKYFIPASKLQEGTKDGANYVEWVRQGLIEVTEGNQNDLTKVADWFGILYKDYAIRTFITGYDDRFSNDFKNRMDEWGFPYEMILQNRYVMSDPMKSVEADLKSQLINYNDNPIDKWCLGNTALKIDNQGYMMAEKIKNQPNRKIDGAITLVILYATLKRYRTEFMNKIF